MPVSCEILAHAQPELNHDQDATLDAVVCDDIDMDRAPLRLPASQNFDEDFLMECALGNAEFCAIRDEWRSSHPILVLPTTVYDNLLEGNSVVFAESSADLVEASR
jgi:hypothetical protein